MLRAFSSIRKTLINEGKTSRYVRYAVGEFLLIVAGILAALQIQTWNEGRKLEQDRQELVENLKTDFQRNLEELERTITGVEETKKGLETFLDFATDDNTSVSVEELKALADNVRPNNPFEPSLGFYRAAISTGSIALLKGSQLNNLFVQFESHNNRLQDMDQRGFEMSFSDSGSYMDIRKQLGTLEILGTSRGWADHERDIPETFKLNDGEYRKFISQKAVYAHFDLKRELNAMQLGRLNRLKDTTKQILAELEALD